MTRTILLIGLVGSAFAFPQQPMTPEEVVAATSADLRGLFEDRAVWERSVLGAPRVERQSPGTASAKRLRHRPSKAARKAYEKAARGKDAGQVAMDLETAVALDPDFAEAHNDLGAAYALLGRYPEAAKELRRAIELVPDESLPHSNLAWVLLAMGQLAEAEASVRRAVQLSPDDAVAQKLARALRGK